MKKIKVAMMYDFDKTLSPKDMQEFTFIPGLGYKNTKDFWEEVNKISKENKMDSILAYMFMMIKKSKEASKPIRKQDFKGLGKGIEYYPGVLTWFDRINAIGKKLNIEVEHYIISSGLTEVIEGTPIAKKFKKIYACKFYYDENGVATWPSLVVNYTTKTQYIFRINKQILDENEDRALNQYTEEKDRPIPFRRMIYVGDGLTDVPCMKLVKENGGKSIVVYNKKKKNAKDLAKSLIQQKRANYMSPSDYSSQKEMEKLVSKILENIQKEAELEELEGVR
ncbi:HAD family hydrolase [Anaerorhabdus sp.]|uniref:HAD family hydrolase n=1 Tax=Anaerorhabdus sp. TaxID=1872524 RepID=UPI002B21A54E|nr:HAD family hydrolase [Anaerorhabdus sp.]MEA4873968.1 HAD family hydrolase [Anaerorhabdus sp.]